MCVCRGLVWLCVVLGVLLVMPTRCPGLPTDTDSTRDNGIHNVVNIAQTTLVRIRSLQLPAALQISVDSPSIGGLRSISQELSLLSNQLRYPALGHLGQIHADVSSLAGSVRFLAETMGCLLAPAAPSGGASLAFNDFPESHFYVSLRKVQVYLDNLLLHRDKLTAC